MAPFAVALRHKTTYYINSDTRPMKTTLITSLLAASCIFAASAQKVYSTDSQYRADVKVFVVDHEYQADLVVYRTDKEYRAKKNENKGVWYFTTKEYQADKKIYFTDREYQADLKVYFTDSEYRAGWKKNDKKYLMY